MKEATIADVARAAGVSTGTVSHVLSGARNVRPETRARVERAIEELGFRPSPIARALSSRRAGGDASPPAASFRQELVGLFGQPVDENPTQAMVEAAFRSLGLDWRYLTLEVAPGDLAFAVAGARAFGFCGFHCTLPHKVAVLPHLDRLGESAERIGAVNCVVRHGDELVGENTDGKGFLRALEQRVDPKGASVVILGAGGAARAIAVELRLAGAGRITVVNRSDRGRELGDALVRWEADYRVPAGTDVLVNATPLGLGDADVRVPVAFSAPLLVADVIPNPPETRLLRDAAAAGCETLDGLGMLVEQGVLAVEYWTGRRPEAAVMRAALAAVL